MRHPIVSACALLPLAVALAACNDQPAPGNDQAATNKVAPPAATPTPVPVTPPSPRSIMQPDVGPEPTPTPTPAGPLSLTIGFPSGGTKLDDAATAQLDTLAADPLVARGGAIVLRGSSDSHGSDADNRAVSKARARAVAAYLVGKGVAKDRITVIALGEDRPVAPNANLDGSDNEAGRRQNRRVDVTVTPPAEPATADTVPANATEGTPADQP